MLLSGLIRMVFGSKCVDTTKHSLSDSVVRKSGHNSTSNTGGSDFDYGVAVGAASMFEGADDELEEGGYFTSSLDDDGGIFHASDDLFSGSSPGDIEYDIEYGTNFTHTVNEDVFSDSMSDSFSDSLSDMNSGFDDNW